MSSNSTNPPPYRPYSPKNRHKDLTGRSFGLWTVLRFSRSSTTGGVRVYWICRCQCGNEREVHAGSLLQGASQSCGCYQRQRATKHGMSKTKEYRAWRQMLDRCFDTNRHDYAQYGGRGITVCEIWINSFEAFFQYMGFAPSPHHSVDRYPNPNGNYEPGNCRWATAQEQARNRTNNLLISHDGLSMTPIGWFEKTGIPAATIRYRILSGWSVEKALTTPARKYTKRT